MNNATLVNQLDGAERPCFDAGAVYFDETTECIYIGFEYHGGKFLVSLDSGYSYDDNGKDPFAGDAGDFRKLYPGEAVNLEVRNG